jgi:hypothetical protein
MIFPYAIAKKMNVPPEALIPAAVLTIWNPPVVV